MLCQMRCSSLNHGKGVLIAIYIFSDDNIVIPFITNLIRQSVNISAENSIITK